MKRLEEQDAIDRKKRELEKRREEREKEYDDLRNKLIRETQGFGDTVHGVNDKINYSGRKINLLLGKFLILALQQ